MGQQEVINIKMDEIIGSIGNDEDYQERLEIFNELIREDSGNNSKKPETIKLLQCINDIVTSEDYEPRTKYYAILIAKDFFLKKYSVFVSSLSSSALLQNMTKMAKTIDPRKDMSQKGVNLFPDREVGNLLMTLILQCIVKWSEKYPSNNYSGEPTKYRLAYNQLVDYGVVLPSKFRFFPSFNMVNSIPQPQYEAEQQAPQRKGREESQKRSFSDRNNIKDIGGNMKLSLNKIEGFLIFLRECEDREQAEREINRYHKKFQEENRQYQEVSNSVLDEGLLDHRSISLLFLMIDFYKKQNQLYILYLQKDNDIKTYKDEVILSSELLTAQLADTNVPEPQSPTKITKPYQRVDSENASVKVSKQIDPRSVASQRQNQIKPRVYEVINRADSISQDTILMQLRQNEFRGYPGDYIPSQELDRYNPTIENIDNNYQRKMDQRKSPRGISNPENPSKFGSYHRNSKLEDEAEQGAMMIKEIFKRDHRPKSSFIQLRKDLEKERTFRANSGLKNTGRRGRNPNVSEDRTRLFSVNETNSQHQTGGISRVSIYKLHPKVGSDSHQGRLMEQPTNYSYQLEEINANQSLSRFKICSLRERHLLFQNQVFQIGFNSEQMYRQHPKHPSLLSITLFLGNITDHNASEVSISFEGDKTNAIYASPLKVPKLIDGRMQIKQHLLAIPLSFPFNLINFKLKYKHKSKLYRINVFLPHLINKFCRHQQVETEEFNKKYQENKSKQIRTKVFSLSQKFPPSLITKYIPNSIQLTSYKQFIQQGKYNQYEVGAKITLLNREKCLVKFLIRPDMTAVIQAVSVGDPTSQSLTLLNSLISTFQFILGEQ